MVAGCAKGYRDGFSIERSPANRDFIAAEEWARTHTPANALFLVIRKHVGFSLFSRRPVWWDHSQGAAVMWSPNFYTVWSCRQRLTATAAQHGDWDDLALKSNADFVLRGSADGKIELTHFVTRYHNAHYSILQRHAPKNNRPPCPEPT
jgi:hypothetical protein